MGIFKLALKWIGIGLAVIILAVYLGIPFAMGVISVLPARSPVGSLPDGFQAVDLRAKDGVRLQAWYHPPENGAVILLLHGAGGSREEMRAHAQMVTRHGYGVLALDLRGHGGSEGKTNRLGWNGTLDVGAAMDFLQTHSEVIKIGGMGSSMGGEVLLGAVSSYPLIQAAAADGATRRCTNELLALEEERPLIHNFTPRVMYAFVQLLSGEQPPTPPLLQSMQAADGTRFFLVAAGSNALETSFNQLFKQTLGDRAELWIAPGAQHTGAFALYPQEYENRLIKFFNQTLLEGKL